MTLELPSFTGRQHVTRRGSHLSAGPDSEIGSGSQQDEKEHQDQKIKHGHHEAANSGISNLYDFKKSLRINTIKNTPFTWKSHSLDFDSLRTKIFQARKKTKCSVFMEWVAYALIGIFTGLTCAVMMHIEEFLVHEKRAITNWIVDGKSEQLYLGWMFFTGFSVILALFGACLTVYYGQGATGSGITELIAYLNGVNYPSLLSFETLFTKIFGVIGAVVGNLCVGKEGPMAHIGANIGAVVAYFPLPGFEYLRNDWSKRELIAAGVSAGVSTAFGAPVGGALFAYEMSKPNTFWRFGVLWKSFFSCSIAVLAQSIIRKLMTSGNANDVSAVHELKFKATFVESPTMATIPAAVILGAICGLLGAFFIFVNTNLNKKRKVWINKPWKKIVEVVIFSILTASAFYWTPKLYNVCKPDSEISEENFDLIAQYDCKKGEYSPLATMFSNEEVGSIRSIMSGFDGPGGIRLPPGQMASFFFVWYLFTILTYGVWVPAGLFLPGIIVGCAVGAIYAEIAVKLFPGDE